MNVLKTIGTEINKIVNNIGPSIVLVSTQVLDKWSLLNPLTYFRDDQYFYGTGMYIGDDIVLTNHHVIEDADNVFITHGKVVVESELIGSDPLTDVALLKLNSDDYDLAKDLEPIKTKRNVGLTAGELVIAIGHAVGYMNTSTLGIISNPHVINYNPSLGNPLVYIQTDASITFGNSGGPLVDCEGNVIGVNTLIHIPELAENIAFAIPIDYALKVTRKLLKNEKIRYGTIGASGVAESYLPSNATKMFNLKQKTGLQVLGLDTEGSLSKAGVKDGDYILGLNGIQIDSQEKLLDYLIGNYVDKEIQIEFLIEEEIEQKYSLATKYVKVNPL